MLSDTLFVKNLFQDQDINIPVQDEKPQKTKKKKKSHEKSVEEETAKRELLEHKEHVSGQTSFQLFIAQPY